MPSKHIKESTWMRVEKLRINAIIETKQNIKERDILELILSKGIKETTIDDLRRLTMK